MKKHVIIVGGGAAGMVAAISARRQGAMVTVLERNPRVGKKLLATGNGRCNFTNINADVNCYSGNDPKFVYSALSAFTVEDTLRFFEKLGIQHKVEDLGKVFPMSGQASSMLDVLLYEMEQSGIQIICSAYVTDLEKKNKRFYIRTESGRIYEGDRVILAAGGKAMPSSGSDGNGLELAAKLGHRITDVFPALVQLMLDGKYFKRIDGVKFVGTAEVLYNKKTLARDRGDILFTNYGVSGPPILQISRKAGELLNQQKQPLLKVVIMDEMGREELREIIKKRIQAGPAKPVDFSFVGLINKRLIPVVLIEAGIEDFKRPVSSLSQFEIEQITQILTDWRFRIRGTKSWPSAQVTAGGIDTREIHQETMESKLTEGLYLAGEIMDIDGLCGGFNLQWAWTSGYLAGQNAAW
ncbi:MAG: NAD(P)/FAD-dependent oxidoreductase [Caldicoprobacterales bacterium]|jgi:predicted Rossmann fold flavoprotein|nr:NAD(P)/FAD-dependent oxidoreductase [Clostridiales bacterium]